MSDLLTTEIKRFHLMFCRNKNTYYFIAFNSDHIMAFTVINGTQ